MARSDPTIYMRIPQELKDKLDEASLVNRRSLTAEVVARLEESFHSRSDDGAAAELLAELAKAKRDSAYAAFISERWLVSLIILWDIYRDVANVLETIGVSSELPEEWFETAKLIGDEADDEFKRHGEEFDPMVLHDLVESSDEEYKAALAGVVKLVSNAPTPGVEQARFVSMLRERILKRKRREYLPKNSGENN